MSERLNKLRGRLRDLEREAFLCLSAANLRYLTGFTGSNGAVLVGPERAFFVTDGRYREQAGKEVTGCEVVILQDIKLVEKIGELLPEIGGNTQHLSVEADHLSVTQYEKLQGVAGGQAELHADTSVVETLRRVKSAAEVGEIREAVRVAEEAFRALLPTLKEGESERQVRRRLQTFMEEFGARKESFETIVLFGERASLPHGQPGETRLTNGAWVLIDFGCYVDGYCSDITRTFCFGKATAEMRERYNAVAEAKRLSLGSIQAGVAAKDVDAAGRAYLEELGLGDRFEHGTGHGIGLEVHEGPRLAKTSEDVLEAGNVVTVEPGVYFPGWGGIRLEDDVLVTDTGAEVLTSLPLEIEPLL